MQPSVCLARRYQNLPNGRVWQDTGINRTIKFISSKFQEYESVICSAMYWPVCIFQKKSIERLCLRKNRIMYANIYFIIYFRFFCSKNLPPDLESNSFCFVLI